MCPRTCSPLIRSGNIKLWWWVCLCVASWVPLTEGSEHRLCVCAQACVRAHLHTPSQQRVARPRQPSWTCTSSRGCDWAHVLSPPRSQIPAPGSWATAVRAEWPAAAYWPGARNGLEGVMDGHADLHSVLPHVAGVGMRVWRLSRKESHGLARIFLVSNLADGAYGGSLQLATRPPPISDGKHKVERQGDLI